jgi:ankyrin repeat protein
LEKLTAHWQEANRKVRTEAKCLIARKEYASAALLQACITRAGQKPFNGKTLDLADLESSAEIASARGDTSEALDIQWIIFGRLMETDPKDGSDKVLQALQRISKLTEISRRQVSRVANRYGLDMHICVQLNQSLYKALCLVSDRWLALVLDSIIKSQSPKERSTHEVTNPIRIALRKDYHISIEILLNHAIGVDFLTFRRISFELTGSGITKHMSDLRSHQKVLDSLPIKQGSILHYAVAFKSEETVLALLNSGVSFGQPRQNDDEGETPLHVAVLIEQPSMMELLLSRGADVNELNSRGYTPYESLLDCLEFSYDVQKAAAFGVALKMVDNGANINSVNHRKHSLLFLAVQSNCIESMVRSILEKGASIHNEEDCGSEYDSLVQATSKGNYALVKMFLEHDIKTHGLNYENMKDHWDTLHETIREQRLKKEDYNLPGREMEEMWFFASTIAATWAG